MREFDHNTTWEEVEDMTVEEAIHILSRHANSDGSSWTARPHMAKACQMAIEALQRELEERGVEESAIKCPICGRPQILHIKDPAVGRRTL